MFPAIGIVVLILLVFGGFAFTGGNLEPVLHALPHEMLIIGGAAVGSLIIGNSGTDLKALAGGLGKVFKGPTYKKSDYLDVILLYLVVTGVGTWARVAAGTPDGAVPPRTTDKVWTAVMLIVLLSQVALGLVDLRSDSLYTFASLAVAAVMLSVVLCDVLTWRDQGRRVNKWWLLHGGKLFTAWGGLVYAVSLRWRISQGLEGRTDTLLPLLLVLGLGAVVAFGVHQAYRNRLAQPADS